MSQENSDNFDHASKMEANGGSAAQLERLQTAGGHINDRTQPSLPVVHRSFANPATLGLLSFATGKYLDPGVSFDFADKPTRHILDLNIWCKRPRRGDPQCINWCPDILWRSLSIHLWNNGIC